jgi:glycosyltransferase involved in cell wall biosynthesis
MQNTDKKGKSNPKRLLFFVGSPLTSTALIYRVGILAEYLKKDGYDVKITAVGDDYYNKEKEIKVKGQDITIVGQAHYKILKEDKIPLSSLEYLKEIFKTIKEFRKTARDFKPDIIQTFASTPASLFLAYSLKNKYNLAMDIDDLTVEQAKRAGRAGIAIKVLDFLESFIPKRIKFVSVNSDFLKKKYPKSIKIPNMIETNKFRLNLTEAEKEKIRKKYGISKDAIAFMSSISLYHGHFDILNYIKENKKKFVFIGGGEGESRLKEEIKRKGLENKITITGKLPQEEVIKILNSLKIGILPLWDEPIHLARHPLKLLEYLASGICVVACNVGEVKNCLNEENSILVRAGDMKALIEKAENAKNTEKLSLNGIKAVKKFDASNLIKDWEKFYDRILSTF